MNPQPNIGWNPLDAAKQWVEARNEPESSTTTAAPTTTESGTRVTELGWLVFGSVALLGALYLAKAYIQRPVR